ncbi:MAG TPA: WD40 repeat domain-containing protein, partial [Gemmataceae bacterium]|nr:WD40 repeat domain-containing protein [Gemmataceae bacterium]
LAGSVLSFNLVLRGQRDFARDQAGRLDEELRRTRRLLYTAQLLRVGSVWESDPTQGLRMLEDPGACPPDLRCFSWGVLHARCKRYRIALTGHAAAVTALAFSRDGKLLACTGSQNTVKLWDVAGQKERATLSGHGGIVMAVAFSPDGRTLASAGMDRTVKLWDLATHKERLTLKGHEDPVSSIAFSPDGSLLVSGAGATRFNPGRRGEVKLWDAGAGRCLTDLRGHQDGVGAVAFAPDGKTVAAAGRDRTVRLWDVSAFAGRAAAAP